MKLSHWILISSTVLASGFISQHPPYLQNALSAPAKRIGPRRVLVKPFSRLLLLAMTEDPKPPPDSGIGTESLERAKVKNIRAVRRKADVTSERVEQAAGLEMTASESFGFAPEAYIQTPLENPSSTSEEQSRGDRISKNNNVVGRLDRIVENFLSGEYSGFVSSSPIPHMHQTPEEVIKVVLDALKDNNSPSTDHGAAIAQKFSVALPRHERLRPSKNPWREILRQSPTAKIFSINLRRSPYEALCSWSHYTLTRKAKTKPAHVGDGELQPQHSSLHSDTVGQEPGEDSNDTSPGGWMNSVDSSTTPAKPAVEEKVIAELSFARGLGRTVVLEFTLQNLVGVWLIHSVTVLKESVRGVAKIPP